MAKEDLTAVCEAAAVVRWAKLDGAERTLTIDLGKLTGERVIASWFNPRTGEATRIDEFTDKKRHAFEPPADGDWVLVLDDAARKFPTPGTPNLNK